MNMLETFYTAENREARDRRVMKVIKVHKSACAIIQNRLDSFLSNELLPHRRAMLLKHLLQCQLCSRELQLRQRAMKRVRGAVQSQAVPPELERRVRERIRADAKTIRRVT